MPASLLTSKHDAVSAPRYLDRISTASTTSKKEPAWKKLMIAPIGIPGLQHTGVHSDMEGPEMMPVFHEGGKSCTELRVLIRDTVAVTAELRDGRRPLIVKPKRRKRRGRPAGRPASHDEPMGLEGEATRTLKRPTSKGSVVIGEDHDDFDDDLLELPTLLSPTGILTGPEGRAIRRRAREERDRLPKLPLSPAELRAAIAMKKKGIAPVPVEGPPACLKCLLDYRYGDCGQSKHTHYEKQVRKFMLEEYDQADYAEIENPKMVVKR